MHDLVSQLGCLCLNLIFCQRLVPEKLLPREKFNHASLRVICIFSAPLRYFDPQEAF